MSQSLMTIREVSSLLQVHPKTVYKWTEEGRIPFIKVNGLIRFNEQEVKDWQEKKGCRNKEFSEFFPKLELPLRNYDKMLLKGDSAVSRQKQRWNYGDYGVFIRKNRNSSQSWYSWHYKKLNGKRKRVRKVIQGAMCREEAVFVARERAVEAFRKEHRIETPQVDMGFRSFSKVFLEDYMMTSRRNWKSDKYRLDAAVEHFGDIELRKITSSLVVKFRDSRLKSGNSESTANRYMALLKKMFNLAVEKGYMNQNPSNGIRFFSEVDTVRDRVLSEDEERLLLEESSERLRPVILMALHTGMRSGEILKLRWANVDLSRRKIKVERTKSRKARFIPINSALFEVLSRLRPEDGGEGLVFPFQSVRTAFENAKARAGIKGVTFHDLRRTFGTRLLEKGVDIVTIQKLYGHSSVLVTERYLHPQDKVSKDAVELLSGEPAREPEKDAVLARICPAKDDGSRMSIPTSLFSVN